MDSILTFLLLQREEFLYLFAETGESVCSLFYIYFITRLPPATTIIKRLRDENRSLLVENQQARWRIDILESQVAVLEEEKKALAMKLDQVSLCNT